jgi:hypothetical protein
MDHLDEPNIEVTPLVVVTQTFPARPSSIPDIRDFVRRCLARSPLSEEDNRSVSDTVSQALLDAAGPSGTIQVSFRIFPDHVEVDVLRSDPALRGGADIEGLLGTLRPAGPRIGGTDAGGLDLGGPDLGGPDLGGPDLGGLDLGGFDQDDADSVTSFADWMADALRREGLTMEAAARRLGVSVKTVSRWIGGTTEPRLRDLRRIRGLFGDIPLS